MKTAAIIVAAGAGKRFKARLPKQFLPLNGKPVFAWSVQAFQKVRSVSQIILVVPRTHMTRLAPAAKRSGILLVPGGTERLDSVQAGLACLAPDITHVAIHDAARPLITPALIRRGLAAAHRQGASVIAVPARDTLKEATTACLVQRTIPRSGIWLAQTPQCFRRDVIEQSYACLRDTRITDDAQVAELAGYPVALVTGEPSNFKITVPEDLLVAATLLRAAGRR
jgi:2-C-methyl-D-erythritol 4-phosphate cytidylyltransferase